ncbi:hypothetical protein SCACP_27980 [Sporomusa carbonis]|uniref:YqaA family protein n=1 Tax=Sporomusa carbonis TaxID=3076075 RepID=UPI003A62DD11
MDFIIQFFHSYGTLGLFVISFIESIFSPILPDVLLVPMALSAPEKAIYYGAIATVASVLGGFLGYAIGNKFGLPALNRYVPPQHLASINKLVQKYGGWAIFVGALAPIPYKFITITAGALRIRMPIFIAASIFGRAKRFLLEGILIFYYGPRAIDALQGSSSKLWLSLFAVMIAIAFFVYVKARLKKPFPSSN